MRKQDQETSEAYAELFSSFLDLESEPMVPDVAEFDTRAVHARTALVSNSAH
jgi:hypothetical protein